MEEGYLIYYLINITISDATNLTFQGLDIQRLWMVSFLVIKIKTGKKISQIQEIKKKMSA